MNLAELVTDPYNRRARLQPALLALLPVGIVALIFVRFGGNPAWDAR